MEKTILSAGFSCVDIIKEPHTKKNKISVGGTAANVASFLSFISKKNISIIIPNMREKYLKEELTKSGVSIIEIGSRSSNCPIIIENILNNKHTFISTCPYCDYKIRNIKLPSRLDINSISVSIEYPLFFFYDRISPGIKTIVSNNSRGWNFYEPNSLRGYNSFIENAKSADIIKFSNDRISESQVHGIINDLQISNVKLIIITLGTYGLKYSIRNKNGLSNWININSLDNKHIVDSSGAGDWLSSVFIDSFVDYYPIKTASIDQKVINDFLLKAQIIASKSCEYIGAHGICENEEGVKYINRVLKTEARKQEVFSESGIYCPNCSKLL